MKNGFSTIELLLSLTIIVIVLFAVITVSFGNQAFLTSSQINKEAIKKAEAILEEAQALARKDFKLVNTSMSINDDIFTKIENVNLLPDFLTKEVQAKVSWIDDLKLKHSVELTTLISNFDAPAGADTCNSSLSGNWQNISIENNITNFATLVHDPSGSYTISDIDAYKGKLYITANNSGLPTKPTFFILDSKKLISDPNDALLGSIDNEVSNGTSSTGLNAVKIAEDFATDPVKIYAYTANTSSSNYNTCNPVTNKNCGQLDIFDITDPKNPILGSNININKSLVKGSAGQSRGNSIFYRNGYLLMGLTSTGGNGPEFHIIDVHSPASLFGGSHVVSPVGSYNVGNDINAVAMRGNYAYIATPNTQELQILDISNPSNPSGGSGSGYGFNSSTGAGNGKSMYLVGDRLYLGKTTPNAGNDIHILNNKTPSSPLPEISGKNMSSSVNAIIVRSNLAFLLTNSELQIFDIGDPLSLDTFSFNNILTSLSLPVNGNITEPSMDCEDNRLYISSNDSSNKSALYVIAPSI